MEKMKNCCKILVCLCLVLVVLTACSGKNGPKLYVDEDGVVTWDAVANAVSYEGEVLDLDGKTQLSFSVDADSCMTYMPSGGTLRIRAVFADGSTGPWGYAEAQKTRVQSGFAVYYEDLQTYEVLKNVDWNSVENRSDGTIYFEAKAPNGGKMRFVGVGIAVSEKTLVVQPGGKLYALDAIGRICAMSVTMKDSGDTDNWFDFYGGYTFTDATKVESYEELYCGAGASIMASDFLAEGYEPTSCLDLQPNFIVIGASEGNTDAFTLSEITVYYDETTYNTGLLMMALSAESYGTHLEGDIYDPSKEIFSLEQGIYTFALVVVPDVSDTDEELTFNPLYDDPYGSGSRIYNIDSDKFIIGNLKNADGVVLDKNNAVLTYGCALEVTLGDYTMDVIVPVLKRLPNAQTLHELSPYSNATSLGQTNTLVIPIYWQDQPENATEETLQKLYAQLGLVVDENGNVTDHTAKDDTQYSLSDYFEAASYGLHSIRSFVTQWYAAPYNYANEMEYASPASAMDFISEIYDWLLATYPNMDWSSFDADSDGLLDSVILLNVGESSTDELYMDSFGYAVHVSMGYTAESAGTPEQPKIKDFVSVNSSFLDQPNVLIHEYSHGFGIVDYYDVTYSGIDAVGTFDLQSGNAGDWNAYSKYAVGWIEPTVVTDLKQGEYVDITIGAFAETGDAIVIPAAGTDFDGPFGEYLILDLFTDLGVNQYDAAAYGLSGVAGVRISHVNANMEQRTITGDDGVDYTIGTIHYANDFNADGKYLLEVIQAGGKNTFTNRENLRTNLCPEDLFVAGDVFNAEDYSEFLTDGCMDDGSAFGYTVEILRIERDTDGIPYAVLRISAK